MLKRFLIATALSALTLGAAQAGPQYIDESGFAMSGYDPVALFNIEQMPVGKQQPPAVPGLASITAEYNGAKWAFATEDHKKMFLANPEKYAPLFDGHCAYGIAQGGKVPGNPNLWRIIDGKLYLNITPTVVGFWEADIPGSLSTATSNWTSAENKPASKRKWTSINDNDGTYSMLAPIKK